MSATRILVYTDGEVIGDGIIRLPFAAALKHSGADVHLTWMSRCYSVYENALKEIASPVIDEVIILPDRRTPFMDFILRPRALRRAQFDLIIDTQRNTRHTVWLRRIRHRNFVSLAGDGLLSTLRLPKPTAHFFERLVLMGEAGLGKNLDPKPLTLPRQWDAEAQALLPDGARYVGFVVGAGHPGKCWRLDGFIALAKHVSEQGFTPVIFLGPMETEKFAVLQAALPGAKFPLQGIDAPSPYLTMALGKRLTAALANDSGGGNMLAAVGTPMVILYRRATVRDKFKPASAKFTIAPEDIGVESMQDIPLDAVTNALDQLLRS